MRGKRVVVFRTCVWRKVETVIHDQSHSSLSKSLGLEEILDEVGILRRPAELMTSIRVALLGELSSGLRPSSSLSAGRTS